MANAQALAALLGGAGAGDSHDAYGGGGDPMSALQNCIQDLHGLMTVMPDAKHTQMIGQALAPLLAIQTELQQAGQASNPRQQLLQQIGGK